MFDDAAASFLRGQHIAVLATTSSNGDPQACTIFYVVDSNGSLIFKSRSGSDHMRSLLANERAAIALYRHDSTYATKAGLQLKGRVLPITDEAAMRRGVDLYSEAFDGAREKFAPLGRLIQLGAESTLYRFLPYEYKFTDGWTHRTDLQYAAAH